MDNVIFRDNGDHLKRFRFEASGITSPNVRVYNCPDANGTLALVGGGPFTEGSVPFANSQGALIEDNANFSYDDGNNILITNTLRVTTGDVNIVTGNLIGPDDFTAGTATHFWNYDDTGSYIWNTTANIGIDTTSPDTKLQVVGTAGFGDDAGNEALFAADGEFTLHGTARVFRSIDFEPEAVKQGGVGPGASTEDDFPLHDYSAVNDESVFIHWEIPHDYADGEEVHLHVEYFVDTAPASAETVTWGVEYKKLSIGDAFDFGAGSTTVIVNDAITTGTPANDKVIHSSDEIFLTTAGFVPMDVILIRIFRDANASEGGATDDFGSDARVFNYHLMYLSDKLGEAS